MKVGRRPESPWGNGPRSERAGALALEAVRLAGQIKPLLAGLAPEVIGAVLAELLATWVAGHIHLSNWERTADTRAAVLAEHVTLVEELVPVVAGEMGLPW